MAALPLFERLPCVPEAIRDSPRYVADHVIRHYQGRTLGDLAASLGTVPEPLVRALGAQVAQALAGVPDLVYVSTYYPEGAKIAQALAKSKLPTRCFMGLANVDAAFVSEAGIIASQRCVFSGLPEAPQFPGKPAKAYVAEYEKAFGKTPGVWGIFSYDSTRLLFAAMEKAGTTAFSPVLANLDHAKGFGGATGSITIEPSTGNRKDVPVFILRVDDRGVFRVAQ